MTIEALLREAKKLSLEERIRFADEVYDSIVDEESENPLTNEQRDELDRRLAAYRADPLSAQSWEEARAELLE